MDKSYVMAIQVSALPNEITLNYFHFIKELKSAGFVFLNKSKEWVKIVQSLNFDPVGFENKYQDHMEVLDSVDYYAELIKKESLKKSLRENKH
jgi:hypothetical protein